MKKTLSWILVLALLLGMMPVHAYAAEGTETVQESAAMDAFTATDALVTAIRQAMVQRQRSIQLRLNGTALTSSEVSELIQQAEAHTGVPNEGDYIRANMLGYSSSVTTGEDAGGVYSIVTIECNFISDADMEAEVDTAVEELLDSLNLWNASDYDKIKGIYDWITSNVDYDYEWDDLEDDTGHYKHTTHAALIAKTAVCQGIASLYYRLMLELGVDCRYISGISTDITGSERHAWNIVCLEGKYYNCDPTWDCGLTNYYRQFLCTQANFSEHTRDAEYDTSQFHAQYPMAVTPYVRNVTASGQVNANIAWVLDGDTGTLTVAGTGIIPSYRFSHAPWYDYRESIQKIVVSEGITEVGERAFYWSTNCTEVVLPNSLVAIREYGFNNLRNLQYITLPPNLKIIEFCAFSECVALVSITLPDSVTTVESNAFSNCYKLTSAVLSAGMKSIPSSMFGGDSSLRSVKLPEGITYIDDTAFINCGFSSFTLPASVTGLGTAVFSGCTSLSAFYVEEGNTVYKAVDGVLFSADGTHLICYPSAKFADYGNYTVPEGTRYIDYGAFRSARYLYGVHFPSTLLEIGGYSFSYCKNLYSVTFPSNIITIEEDAFRSCTGLYEVTFKNPNVDLVGYTFASCTSLRSITLPANLRQIPNGLFYGCTNLQSITIPSTVTRIGSSAFLDCDGLRTITIPGTVKSIGQQAFDFCNKLETITFQEGVQTLGWICIRNAPKLKTVVIPKSVTKIEQPYNTDSYTFDDCPNAVLYVNCGSYGHRYAMSRGLNYQASHTVVANVVPPTCTQSGYTHYYCSCGNNDYISNYRDALGHAWEAWETTQEPACAAAGSKRRECSRCGYVEISEIPAVGHSYNDWTVTKAATCTEDGEERRDCANCDHYETRLVEATGHNYKSVVTAPTCTERGYTTHTCACGHSFVDSYVDAMGHKFGDWTVTKAATCTEDGEERRDCANCNHYETRLVEATGHNYKSVVTAPTCTERGYTTHTCACGDSYVDSYVDATGHKYGDWTVTKAATCTEDGQERRDCVNCDHYETRTVEATGHDYESVVTPPTCTERGYTTYTCNICGESYVDSYVDATGHKYGDWTVTKAETCTEDGQERRDCANCDHYEIRTVTATGHDYESVVTPPTCTERGYTTYTCACGDSYVDSYVEATGHTAVTDTALQPTSAKTGLTEGSHCEICGTVLVTQNVIPARGYDWMLEDGEFKILLIGNSFSEDASNAGMPNSQMLDIFQAMLGEDVKITVGLCYSGGKGLNWHATQSEQGNSNYSLRVISSESGAWKSYGAYSSSNALTWTDWDVVSLQHYEINTTTGKESNAYPDQVDPKFDNLEAATEFMLDYVDEHAPDAAVYFYMHWARAYKSNLNESLSTYNKMAGFFPVVLDYTGTESANRFETIIPVGLSVQNARTTYLSLLSYNTTAYADGNLNLTTDAQIGLQRDGGHLSYNVGRYIAGLTFAETIIPAELRVEGYELPDIRITESVGKLPKEYTVIAQKSVWAAVESWKRGDLGVTNIEGYTVDPTVTAARLLAQTSVAVCGATEQTVRESVLALLPADFAVDEVTITGEATCNVTIRFGYTSVTVSVNLAEADHAYDSAVTNPTCTEKGYTTHTCAKCGDSYVDSYVEATGHSWGEWEVVKEPTAQESGQRQRTCAVCGEAEREEIPKLEIVYGDANADGGVNALDLILLRQYLAGWDVTIDDASDANGDGASNALDLILLRQYLAGWDVTLGPKE